MQLNRTGIGLMAFFGLFGLGMIVAPIPGEAGWILKSIGAIWLLVTLGLVWYARRQEKNAAHQDWVFQSGVKGRATVLDVSSHAEVNEMPVMKLKLELEIPGHGTRQAGRREIMPVFSARRMEPGLVLPVYVNPHDADDFVLVW
jgi:hypothetical protein